MRTAFLTEARKFTRHVSVVVDGAVFFVPTSDRRIGAGLFVKTTTKDMVVLARALGLIAELGGNMPTDPQLVDVGANLGTTTVRALRCHGFSSAIALEPSPETFRALQANMVVNSLDDRVQALQVAVSDEEAEGMFDVSDPNSGAHRLRRTAPENGQRTVTVEVVTLDGLVERGVIDLDRVGLLWVDAAGHESRVLAGASRVLAAGVPVVTALKGRWPRLARAVADTVIPHYTDVVDLRGDHRPRPAAELAGLVAAAGHSTDVLLVRR